jgi:uracil-DNA glycosylase
MADIRIEPSWKSWKAASATGSLRPDMQQLSAFLRQRKAAGATIYPAGAAASSPPSMPPRSMR